MTPFLPPADVLDRITDTFTAIDRDWRIVYLNTAAERLIRRPREELVGHVVWDLYPEARGTIYEAMYRKAFEENAPQSFEAHWAPLDLWTETHVYPSPTGLSIYSTDITARKRAERALAEAQERYRLVAENAFETILVVDPGYKVVWSNTRALEMFGIAKDGALVGTALHDLVVPEDLPLLEKNIAERRQGKSAHYDIRMRRADGSVMWILARVAPLLDERGVFQGALGMLTDITDRKRAEAELLAQKEWFQVTLRSIGDAVIATDDRGCVTFMNHVAEELTGWSSVDARGRRLNQVFVIVNENTREHVESPVDKVLREGKVVGLANHTSLIARDGTERPIDDSGAPIRDADGKMIGVVLVFRDNTERANAERGLREADRRKDEFLAMLAHELRNPLAPMRSATELMRLAPDDERARERARDIVERQVQHMTRLVDDLLDVSRITSGKIKLEKDSVELKALAARAVETVAELARARRQVLSVELPAEPLTVVGDATRLSQVIANLLNNAVKFTPEEGHIWLSVAKDERSAVIKVRDDGAGIPSDSLSRVFELFMQVNPSLDRQHGGLGIGLTLVKRLVEMHDGRVEVHSAGIGKGATFTVRIPIAEPSAVAAARPSPPRTPPSLARRVLVVDDNTDAAEMLAMLLEHLGHEATVAHDGHHALARLSEAAFDVVLLDIGLPTMSGFDVVRRLRSEPLLSGLKVVALTGYGQKEDLRRTRDAGFDAHLVKPVGVDTLRSVLASLDEA